MSVIDDALSAILKGSNPDASPEDIQSQVDSLKKTGGEAVNQALSFIPGLTSMKDIAVNAPTAINELAKTPLGGSLGSSMLGGPVATNIPNAGNPISNVSEGIVAALANHPIDSQTPAPSAPSPLPATPPVSPTPDATAPVTPASTPSPAGPPAPPAVPSVDLSAPSADNDARQKALADAERQRKLAGIPAAIAGAGDTIAKGAQAFGLHIPTDQQDKLLDRAKANFEESKGLFEEKTNNDPNSDISKAYRQMVLQIAPEVAKQPAFQSMSAKMIGDKLPLIDNMMKAQAAKDNKELSLKQMQSNKEISLGERKDQFEDRAVNQGLARIASIRGDASLARSELQRDAAITAVNRINEVHAAGKELNPVDYADILGQTYKARSGSAPDQEIMNQIRQPIGSASFNRAWTFLTGKQAPATSKDISNSLLDIATSMGKQADTFHDAYMAPHLVKPAGVSDEKWNPIIKTGRGMSFSEGTKQKAKQPSSSKDPMGILG